MLKIEVDIDIKTPKVKVSDLVNDIADEVKRDHLSRVNDGKGVNGSLKSLKPSTIASKKDRGYSKPSTPLYATGKMAKLKDYKKATKNDPTAIVGVRESREDIATYHQEGTSPHKIEAKNAPNLRFVTENGVQIRKSVNHPGNPKREWFGISKNLREKIDKMTDDFTVRFIDAL